ncbi:hypothetical protein Naga_100002g154 [Nannochloropsis gaditana]|uniref:Uncharacterized protein n=1 Tax=Nannochloropsis gaditana TaxID=72520 RepID=W7TRF8_9STRA|nr:hypothetical protein Naga_100002g154 [Nannochloropsis gaditana]
MTVDLSRGGRKTTSSSAAGGAAATDSHRLDQDGVPNEGVLQAIEYLGHTCSVHDVVARCGLPQDLVEAEMAAFLRVSNGFFEVLASPSANDDVFEVKNSDDQQANAQHLQRRDVEYVANVFSTDNVRYVYPSGLRSLLRRRFVLMRLREAGVRVLHVAFKVVRISFGILLMLSLLIVVIVIVVVVARSGGGEHRHGQLDMLRVMHRPRRHYLGGGGMGGGDWRDMYYMWWWWNYNPFLFGRDPQMQAQRWREQQTRRRRVLGAMDEEGGRAREAGEGGDPSPGSRRRTASSASLYRLPRAPLEGTEGGGEGDGQDVDVDMTFVESVFSLLFGDGPPGPSQSRQWQTLAKLIHERGGIVLPEEIALWLRGVDPNGLDRSMFPVCARFGGQPVRCIDGETRRDCGYIYDFAGMRDKGRHSTLLSSTALREDVEEGGKGEMEARALLAPEGGGKGGQAVVEMTRVDMTTDAAEAGIQETLSEDEDDGCSRSTGSSSSSWWDGEGYLEEGRYVFSRAPLHLLQCAGALGFINLVGAVWVSNQWILFPEPGSTALYAVGRILLWYAVLYVSLPLIRLATIAVWNRGISQRNQVRKALWKAWKAAGEDSSSSVYLKMQYAHRVRMELGIGLGGLGRPGLGRRDESIPVATQILSPPPMPSPYSSAVASPQSAALV